MANYPFAQEQPITQFFGTPHPRYHALGQAGHNGVDFACPLHTPVLCVSPGEVWETHYDPAGYGYYVKVRTPDGSDWLYAHLALWQLPRPGTYLDSGQPVGLSGSSGLSTGPHLHLGFRPQWWVRGYPYDGYADPLPYLTAP